jgi:hypothetical protein
MLRRIVKRNLMEPDGTCVARACKLSKPKFLVRPGEGDPTIEFADTAVGINQALEITDVKRSLGPAYLQ